jgi:hypothetical protein
MLTCGDIKGMIEALTTSIAVHEREEALFNRSACASVGEEARQILFQISEEMHRYIDFLLNKKQELMDQLNLQLASKKLG